MLVLIKDFLVKNYKWLLLIIALLVSFNFVDHYLYNLGSHDNSQQKIDSLNNSIHNIELQQKKLDSNINTYHSEIKQVDANISNIKSKQTIITNNYHEKIDSVNHYTDDQLRLFFTKRYGYPAY